MRAKKLAAAYPVPQNDLEADGFIARLGAVRRDLARAEADMNDELAAVKARHEAQAQRFKEQETQLLAGLEAFAAANRERLTSFGKVKFHRFAAGEIKWRTRPPKVSIRAPEAVIEALKSLGLGRFVRAKEEINKEAILAEPEAVRGVRGVSIGSEGEDFVVEPFAEELAKGAAA
jgi:phage host-nuclease inhibitor protein Gam